MKLTRQQREALYRVYNRGGNCATSYRDFRKTVQPGPGCIMLPWAGMWLGIEPDGYTHS